MKITPVDSVPGLLVNPVSGVFAGSVQPMPGDGRPTAIFKQPVDQRLRVGLEGLEGDMQADRRVHGGPEKAVHHFPLETHALLSRRFPEAAATLGAGGLGENVSTLGFDESNVCIGDVFALGTARVQLCQPRTPCWKIEARHGVEGMTHFIAERGIAGWYYRVLEVGTLATGDDCRLLDREADAVTLASFWRIVREHRPDHQALQRLVASDALAESWKLRIAQRLEWLRAH